MSEQITEYEALSGKTQEPQIRNSVDIPTTSRPSFSIKKIAIIIIAAAVVAFISITITLLVPSKFERVRRECIQITGFVTGSGDYFIIDTYPDEYAFMGDLWGAEVIPNAEIRAMEAIRYANKELGFNGSVYSKMMETTALMGRQSEENRKYRVSWTYHPDEGLEVTYEKK